MKRIVLIALLFASPATADACKMQPHWLCAFRLPKCDGDQRALKHRCLYQTDGGAYVCSRDGCERI